MNVKIKFVLQLYEPETPLANQRKTTLDHAKLPSQPYGTLQRVAHEAPKQRKNSKKAINKNQRFCPTLSEQRHK